VAEFLELLFDVPALGPLTYRNDETRDASFGRRVVAPFGNREKTGYVVGESDSCGLPLERVKRVGRSLDDEPLFDESAVELARWLAGMYFCGQGEALAAMLPQAKGTLRSSRGALAGRGSLAEVEDVEFEERPLELSDEQRAALDRITRKRSGLDYLYGLTGTGKTEVFLQAAEATLAEGRGVIYLVPEIALTGQVVEAAARRFGESCAVLHSRLTPARRLAEWRRILRGEARVVVGARSAVFAPVRGLGLIVLDEEHEATYKSGSTPRYHARQVAMRRGATEGARVVMGSATPSVEAWSLMEGGAIERLPLTRRLAGGAPPAVRIVDMRQELGPISRPLAEAVRSSYAEGRQSILFLNRRGFSYFFRCGSCGKELRCPNCSVSLTYHKDRGSLICHYCGYRAAPPGSCPDCGSLDVGWAGFGTERVEEEAEHIFPGMRIRRVDADSTSKAGELEAAIEDFREGKADILLGTQMVAKGLNFPRVKTVGVVLADTSLNLPDFRAAERTFALVVQVAGRAGRFSPDGEVILQTYRPDSPVMRLAAAADASSFYRLELEARKELFFPPFSRLIRVVFRSKEKGRASASARDFASLLEPRLPEGAELLGPAECPLGMVAGTARWQLIARAPELGPLHKAVGSALADYRPRSTVRLESDVDPVSLM
jgi:primosomal protein N' (replication factor Y)